MAARAQHIAFGKATFLGMRIRVPLIKNWPRISSKQREWRLGVRNTARYMAEIREKQLGAALRKGAVTMLARALRKAPGDPDKSASQLSCSLLKLETWRFFAAELLEDGGTRRGNVYSLGWGNSKRK